MIGLSEGFHKEIVGMADITDVVVVVEMAWVRNQCDRRPTPRYPRSVHEL
jgi:hypothetical protein